MLFVFLHAFPLNSHMWEPQNSIAPGRTICPNLYGLGNTLEEWATSVLALVDCNEEIVVVGSSMGGACAIEMARQAPTRIAALVLVGTKAGHRPEPNARDAYIKTLRINGINGIWPEISTLFSDSTSTSIINRAMSIANQQHPDELINAVRVFHTRPDLEHVLRNWQKPYLVISGDCDPMFPREKSLRISRLGSNGCLSLLDNCGHFSNMEKSEEFNFILSEFVANAI